MFSASLVPLIRDALAIIVIWTTGPNCEGIGFPRKAVYKYLGFI